LLHVAIAALGVGFLWRLPALSAGLGAVAFISLLVEEMTWGPWLSRPLLRLASFNVIGRLPKIVDPALRVVVCAHYDTQRTGLIMSLVERSTALQWRLPVALKPPLLPLGLCFGLQALGGIGAIWVDGPLASMMGCLLAAAYTVFILLFTQWAVSPFVPGAADNASGAAAALTLAEIWTREPIPGVDLVVVLTGCEETGMLGAAAWADRHRAENEAVPTCFVNLDGLGFGPPRFLGSEVPVFGWPLPYPGQMIAAAREVAEQAKLTDAGPHALPGPTDGLALLVRGLPGITIVGFQTGGRLPNYHQLTDTCDRMDQDAAWAGVRFAWRLLQHFADGHVIYQTERGKPFVA
jgi:hypothetical protein